MRSDYDEIFVEKITPFRGSSPFDGEVYRAWRDARLKFLSQVFPQLNGDESNRLSVIEFGAGFGAVGIELSKKVSLVAMCEGRAENFEEMKARIARNPRISAHLLDNDSDWGDFAQTDEYDLAIHWGLLYHLKNWRRDLALACRCARHLCLETEVLDSVDPNAEIWRHELGADQALHGVGTVPSWGAIEQVLKEEGMSFERHDSCLLYTSPSPRDYAASRMPSSA